MKFIYENDESSLTFSDVPEDSFFVDKQGYLCQKSDDVTYVVIANYEGKPVSYINYDIARDFAIERVIPKVKKIEF